MSYTTKSLTDVSAASNTSVGGAGSTTAVTGWRDVAGSCFHIASHKITNESNDTDLRLVYSEDNEVLNQEVVITFAAGLDSQRASLLFRWHDYGSHTEYIKVYLNLASSLILVQDVDSGGVNSPTTAGDLSLNDTDVFRVRVRLETVGGTTTLTIQVYNVTLAAAHLWNSGSDTKSWNWSAFSTNPGAFSVVGDSAKPVVIDYRDDQTPPQPEYGTLSIEGTTTTSIHVKSTAATGGTAPYAYLWEAADSIYGPWTTASTSLEFTETGLTSDTPRSYRLTVTDAEAQQIAPDPTGVGTGCVSGVTRRVAALAITLRGLGDSNTSGGTPTYTGTAATVLGDMLGIDIPADVSAVGGSSAAGWFGAPGDPVTSQFTDAMADAEADGVTDLTIRFGTNDTANQADFGASMLQGVAWLRDNKWPELARVWLETAIYRPSPKWGFAPDQHTKIREYQVALREIQTADDGSDGLTVLLGNFNQFDELGQRPELYSSDGIHLTQTGLDWLGRSVAAHMYATLADEDLPGGAGTDGAAVLLIGF